MKEKENENEVPTLLLRVKASPWAHVKGSESEARMWDFHPHGSDQTIAAYIYVTSTGVYRWACYSPFSECLVGSGVESTLKESKKVADATLREYARNTRGAL